MRACWHAGVACFAFVAAGCVSDNADCDGFALRNPFKTERAFDPSSAPQASTRIATRVVTVGNDVLAANGSAFDNKPVFFTSGSKDVQIFHVKKSGMVVLSEGLVEQCRTDAELAAAICHELGKMAAEKSERDQGTNRLDAPPAPRLSPDVVGGGAPDMTRQAEEAYHERRRLPASRAREPGPDAKTLAHNFLVKAGHNADDLHRMESLLKEAEKNGAAKRDFLK